MTSLKSLPPPVESIDPACGPTSRDSVSPGGGSILKRCARCGCPKELSLFHNSTKSKDGKGSYCKDCNTLIRREQRLRDPEKTKRQHLDWVNRNREHVRDEASRWYHAHKEKRLLDEKKRYHKNPNRKRKQAKEWGKRNPSKLKKNRAAYVSRNYATNEAYRVVKDFRARFCRALKRNYKTGQVVELLGCTIPELKEKITALFAPGMSWDNRKDWDLDHITPLHKFNTLDKQELKRALNYSNLQPLWKRDHVLKTKKETHEKAMKALEGDQDDYSKRTERVA